ncbi:MAG: hypothetical protein ABI824_07775, partial [Acidobacteriota bacterium]
LELSASENDFESAQKDLQALSDQFAFLSAQASAEANPSDQSFSEQDISEQADSEQTIEQTR